MKMKFTYSPEGGSKREWMFDAENPAWDLAYVTETETGWAWQEFVEKLAHGSHVALRALVYAFRKRDEQRLTIDAVTVTLGEIDIEDVPEPKKAAKGDPEA
jgi:hypothetical protein